MIKALARNLVAHLLSPGSVAAVFRRKRQPFTWGDCKKIVVIKLDAIGDFVLATPFLRELRRNCPKAEIVLVVQPLVFPLAETCPYANRVLAHNPKTKGLSLYLLRQHWRAWRTARLLREPTADVAVIPRRGEDAYAATFLARYCGARAIVAYTERAYEPKRQMNPGYDRLVTHPAPASPDKPEHEITANLGLLSLFGGAVASSKTELWITTHDEQKAAALLGAPRRVAAIATGASEPCREWSTDRFSEMVHWLKSIHGFEVILLGLANDPSAGELTLDLRGKTSLRETAAILKRCSLFVGNDSGAKHIAAAVGCPVVEINGLRPHVASSHNNSPARFGTDPSHSVVVRPPEGAGDLAIDEISTEAVKSACLNLLSQNS